MGPDIKRNVKLVIIDSDVEMVRTIKTHLTDKGIRVAGEATNLKAGMRLIRGVQPNLVLIEVPADPDETLEAVREIRAELPDCGIILSSEAASPQLILTGVRAGAQEFVTSPVVPEELETAIEHVRGRLERRTAPGRRRGKVITLFSSKGGSGCSMVATNLASALERRAGNRVVLVDLHFQLGDLELMLDVRPRYGLADVIGEATLEEAQLRSVLTPHSSGLFLLTVAGSPEDGQKVERQHLSDVFGLLSNMFEYVVVDMERHIDERTLEILDRSEHILLVSALNVPSVRNTKRYLELFRRLEIDTTKLEVVVNRYDTKKGGVNVRELEKTVGVGASWLIPNDFQVVSDSIDAGVPFVFGAPNSKVGRSFQDFATRIAAESVGSKETRPAPTPTQVK